MIISMKMLKMQNSKIILIQKLRIDCIFCFQKKKKNMGMISNEKFKSVCCILTNEKIFIIALYFDIRKDIYYCVVF